MVVINTNPSKQRPVDSNDLTDDAISAGDYVGTATPSSGFVWHFDGSKAVRVGVPDPGPSSICTPASGQTLRDAFAAMPMFQTNPDFVVQRMELPPGAYYPRIARPNEQHRLEAPGSLPEAWKEADLIAQSLGQVRSLVGMLDAIFQAVHPDTVNMKCFGGGIRNVLILACMECEAQWRGVLTANGYSATQLTTKDYVKTSPALRLNEYAVKLHHYPWLPGVSPFEHWEAGAPTQSIAWYDDYNAAKHDREGSFARANLASAVAAVSAAWIMIAAQFGTDGLREFNDLNRYFHLERVPLWRYSQVYTHGDDGHNASVGRQPYSF